MTFHLRPISQEIHQSSFTKIHLKITYLEYHSSLPGANELITKHPGQCGDRSLMHKMMLWQQHGFHDDQVCHGITLNDINLPNSHLKMLARIAGLTRWIPNKMDNIFVHFKCIFLNENHCILIWISPEFVHKGLIGCKSTLVQVMAWCRAGTKHQAITWTNGDPGHMCHKASMS